MSTHSQVGESPLILAAGFGRVECVNLLLSRGAIVNHQDKVRVLMKCIYICVVWRRGKPC